jgi:hypothetical protein
MYDGSEARILRRIQFFGYSFELLLRNYRPLVELIDRIVNANPLELFGSVNTWRKEELLKQLSFCLHDYVAAVKSLVDHSRTLYNQTYRDSGQFPDYTTQVETTFVNDPEVALVQGLRELAQHYELPNVTLIEMWGSQPAFSVVLRRDDLLKFAGWKPAVKRYLQAAPGEFSLPDLCERYQHKVTAFYEWMYERLREIHADEITKANAEEMKLYRQWLPRLVNDLEREVASFEGARRVDMTRVFNQILFTSEHRDLYDLEATPIAWTEAALAMLATRTELAEPLIDRIKELAQRAVRGRAN